MKVGCSSPGGQSRAWEASLEEPGRPPGLGLGCQDVKEAGPRGSRGAGAAAGRALREGLPAGCVPPAT